MSELVITHKRIDLNASPILYDRPISLFSFVEDWEVHNASWRYNDDALVGKNDTPEPGVILSKKSFPGNVLVDFYGQTVLPSTHNISVMWNTSWDGAAQRPTASYIAAVGGLDCKNAVIQRAPDYKLIATAPAPWFEDGRLYHIQAGSIDGHCFLFVNGELRLEVYDADPINSSDHSRVGFKVHQNTVKISRVVVRQIV